MTTYIEYQLEDGTTLLIEAEEQKTGGVRKASVGKDGNAIPLSGGWDRTDFSKSTFGQNLRYL